MKIMRMIVMGRNAQMGTKQKRRQYQGGRVDLNEGVMGCAGIEGFVMSSEREAG